MSALTGFFTTHRGGRGRPRRAAFDFPASAPCPVPPVAGAEPDGEPEPAPMPEAVLAETVPGSPAQELAAVLNMAEAPGADHLLRLLHGLRAYRPCERGATMPNPAIPCPEPARPARVPASHHPYGPVLLSVSDVSPIAQPLAGMPGWRTANGKRVLHLGTDPASPREAFALAGVSDEWLDALAEALADRPGRAPRLEAPVFTPRGDEAASGDDD